MNYLITIVRMLVRRKTSSLMNVMGLAVGIAVCSFMLLLIRHESSYDQFHEHPDKLYRVALEYTMPGRSVKSAVIPVPLISRLQDLPDVSRVVEFRAPKESLLEWDQEGFYEQGIAMAGERFFDLFSFQLQRGDPSTALVDPHSVVLTADVARRMFGSTDPLGKDIRIEKEDFRVTGVLEPVAKPSHLQFSALISWSSFRSNFGSRADEMMESWGVQAYAYIETVATQEDVSTLEDRLTTLASQLNPNKAETAVRAFLQPVPDIHLYHTGLDTAVSSGGNPRMLVVLATIAVLILLIACVNYVNLATAQARSRAREIGLRQAVGASRSQLMHLVISESAVLVMAALILALVLLEFVFPFAASWLDLPTTFSPFSDPSVWLILPVLAIITALASSWYPAFVLARMHPVAALRGSHRDPAGRERMKKGLVVGQFTAAIVLIIGAGVVRNQLSYVQNVDVGFERDQILSIPIREPIEYYRKHQTIKSELLQLAVVEEVTATLGRPGIWSPATSFRPGGTLDTSAIAFNWMAVDFGFTETFGISLVEGRTFDPARSTDSTGAFLINETAMRALGGESVFGKYLDPGLNQRTGEVIGVVEDFPHGSLHAEVEPLLLYVMPPYFFQHVHVRIAAGSTAGGLEATREIWSRHFPDRPFEYTFYDQAFEHEYLAEKRQERLAGMSALLAILVACFGLFGMAAHMGHERTREIGIRKVLGASVTSVLALVSGEFLKLVAVSFMIAVPVAIVATDSWLSGFAYRMNPGVGLFLSAGLLAMVIATVTVGGHALRAAYSNPVQSLRQE